MRNHLRSIVAVGAVVVLSSCVLGEGREYVIQDTFPPGSGAHATIKVSPTALLHFVDDTVAAGGSIDSSLDKYTDTNVHCDFYANTRYYGDRCAYRVLRATRVTGTLAGAYWTEITDWGEFDDFRNDGMGQARPRGKGHGRAGSCLHVTFKFVDPIYANWTYRSASDSKC